MNRCGGWRAVAGGVLAAAAIPGCSDAPRAIQTAREVQAAAADATVELPKGQPPEASDPAAAKVVAEAIAAHTDGHPERLEKLRTVRLTRIGSIFASDPPLRATWQLRAAWPDRYRTDIDVPDSTRFMFARSGNSAWKFKQIAMAQKEVYPAGPDLQGILADTTYEWLALLVPLGDPGLVAVPAADATIGGKPAAGVWLSGKNLPRAVAHFDKATKLLAQFTYEGLEAGGPVLKEVRAAGTRDANGVKVPDKLRIKWAGRPAAEWAIDSIEFPVEFPAKLFDEP